MAVWTRKARGGVDGPWHQGRTGWQTLCGRKMKGITESRSTEPPSEQRRCEKCTRHAAEGTATSYRRT